MIKRENEILKWCIPQITPKCIPTFIDTTENSVGKQH